MSEHERAEPEIELLLRLSVQTSLLRSLAATPLGDRAVFDVLGGDFTGDKLRGRVLASGGDWLTRTAAGSQLDVRLLLETDDGVPLLFRYTGRASQRAGQPRIEVAGSFDVPDGAYGWLNHVQAFGLGMPIPEGVSYHLYRFK